MKVKLSAERLITFTGSPTKFHLVIKIKKDPVPLRIEISKDAFELLHMTLREQETFIWKDDIGKGILEVLRIQ